MDVINLYGGPCSGKSTIMAGVFCNKFPSLIDKQLLIIFD